MNGLFSKNPYRKRFMVSVMLAMLAWPPSDYAQDDNFSSAKFDFSLLS
jgi:hypothetical protein